MKNRCKLQTRRKIRRITDVKTAVISVVEQSIHARASVPVMKEWRSDGWWEWWWRQRWADKWMRRWVDPWLARLTEWIRELIPEMRWCIMHRPYLNERSDFQWGDCWWARKSGNRWGAGTSRRLNRDQIVKVARFTGSKNFVGKRQKFMFNAFVDIKPMERLRMEVISKDLRAWAA